MIVVMTTLVALLAAGVALAVGYGSGRAQGMLQNKELRAEIKRLKAGLPRIRSIANGQSGIPELDAQLALEEMESDE